MRTHSRHALAAALLTCSIALLADPANAGQTCREWFKSGIDRTVEPQDTQMALFEPDCYAWRLFVTLNWPAAQNGCSPDTTRKLGEGGEVVWEKWIPKQKVFLKDAKAPPPWSDHCKAAPEKLLEPTAQFQAVLQALPDVPGFETPQGDISTAADEEVRLNQGALAFVTDEKLFSLTQQRKSAAEGKVRIDFPRQAKEVKAHWIKLDNPADRQRYHTAIGKDGSVFGLVALHFTTKDLPNWFWATFEHIDNKTRWAEQRPTFFAGWTVPAVDRYACEGKMPSCEEIPKGIGLEGTKWQFYRLKATQVDWVDSLGNPTLVVNSKIEGFFIQNQSSCISCHSLARIGDKSGPMPFSIVNASVPAQGNRVANFIGVITKNDLRPTPSADAKFLQLDFVWALRNACPEPGDPVVVGIGPHCRN